MAARPRATSRCRLCPLHVRRAGRAGPSAVDGKVALVGWSDGGITGPDIAINHPERLSKLLAFGAGPSIVARRQAERRQGSGVRRLYREGRHGLREALADAERLRGAPRRCLIAMWYSQPDYKPEQLGEDHHLDGDRRRQRSRCTRRHQARADRRGIAEAHPRRQADHHAGCQPLRAVGRT